MQAIGGQNMPGDQIVKRPQGKGAGAHLVGQRGQAEFDALAPITVALPVQRLMLAILLEQDHRQQARSREPARHDMEGRRRLADLLAVPAGELLAHRLDHLPPARDHFQRLGDVLAQLRQSIGPAAATVCRRRNDHPLARQMIRERLARRDLALERLDHRDGRRSPLRGKLILCGRRRQILELQLHLRQKPNLALRAAAIKLTAQLLDLELQVGDQRLDARGLGRGPRRLRLSRGGLDLRGIGARLGHSQCRSQCVDLSRRHGHWRTVADSSRLRDLPKAP